MLAVAFVWLFVLLVFRLGAEISTSLVTADTSGILILGAGGAAWMNGTSAFKSNGTLTWACFLNDQALALVDEDIGAVWKWHPERSSSQAHAALLSTLRRPVQCTQRGDFLFVACFGEEEEPGRSGIALIHVASWTVWRELTLGSTHVHHTYPFDDGVALYTDVGDPWVTPPVLGGLYVVSLDTPDHDQLPCRVGPPMHARAATLSPPAVNTAGNATVGVVGSRSGGSLDSGRYVSIITQEPFGEATYIVTLESSFGRWDSKGGFGAKVGAGACTRETLNATMVSRISLPAPPLPGDGGADIFVIGDRMFASDRYGGNGRLYELRWLSTSGNADGRDGGLAIVGSVALGLHPRYTDPLEKTHTSTLRREKNAKGGVKEEENAEESSFIYSVSRDDGLLTIIDARTLATVAQQPSHLPKPCFAVRWR